MYRLPSTTISPNMLCLKYQFDHLTKIYIIPIVTRLYELSNKKLMPTPNLRYMLTHRLNISHQKCCFDRHPALQMRCCIQNYLKNLFRISQDNFSFSLFSCFYKPIVSNCSRKKYTKALVFKRKFQR